MDKIVNAFNDFDIFKEYLLKGKGILANPGTSVNVFTSSNYSGSSQDYPDLQFTFFAGFGGDTKSFNYKDNVYIDYECGPKDLWDDINNVQNMLIYCIQNQRVLLN